MCYEVIVLFDGYSKILPDNRMDANCSCVLIKGKINIIVDTMTAWDRDKIVEALDRHQVQPDEINYVICTHSHPDHIGNNNLFIKAEHIVGTCFHRGTIFSDLIDTPTDISITMPSIKNRERAINDEIKVIATPGHTFDDVTVVVNCKIQGENVSVAIAGDLFEKIEDIDDPSVWKSLGMVNLQKEQAKNRLKIINIADYIVPGHGKMFRVNETMRRKVQLDFESI